jgi:hypothetical protein
MNIAQKHEDNLNNIFGFQLAVKKFVKWNTINFLNYALILRRSV